MAKSDEILVATRSFVTKVGDRKVRVRAGHTRVRANDPIVKGRESSFAAASDPTVETTRRAPGERRTTKRPTAKKAARKKSAKKKTAKKATTDKPSAAGDGDS